MENTRQAEKYFPDHCINWINATRLSRFGRAIGGVMIGVKRSLTKYNISYHFHSTNEVQCLHIKTAYSTLRIIPLYLRSANWSNDYSIVKNFVEQSDCDNYILIGDLNIRIGNLQQDIAPLYRELFPAGKAIRKSKDEEINAKGRTYLEFCNENNLMILNGQTRGDENGNLTFISTVGESVNDICSVSQSLLKYVEGFHVDEKIWSDHLPIVLTLELNSPNNAEKKLKLLPKLHWKDADKYIYQSKLNRNLQTILENNERICLKDLTGVITASSEATITSKFTPKMKWFNETCHWARRKVFENLRKFRKNNNEIQKQKYLSAKKKYKEVCEMSKRRYFCLINEKINNIKNGKEWWKLVKEINNQELKISHKISVDMLKDYFIRLLNPEQTSLPILYAPMLATDHLLDMEITVDEVKDMLQNVKLHKAPGEDRIPYEFFIHATEGFLSELARGYNKVYENADVEDTFIKTIIFPIHKKGCLSDVSNYRGISFMNCVAKIFMGILNERLITWIETRKLLLEYQAGFRRNYSAADNIYNLAAIVNIKMAEKKKVYAFFVDFKAAFDNVSRSLLIYKLHELGISYKFVKMVESIYKNTKSAVWAGEEISEYFDTLSGVKQGCLLSPLLFALYLNDLHDFLKGGLYIEGLNIRLLLYADDIVILAEDKQILQLMITNLEKYCSKWNLTVNMAKSKIIVFRKGGRLAEQEKWVFKGEQIEIVSQYNYLGVIVTPQMSFLKHIQNRNSQSKSAINVTWKNFINKDEVPLAQKWNMYQAVCRAIQSYAAQVWGHLHFDEVDKLQRFFLKRVLRLPESTPNYAISIETGLDAGHIYTLKLHLNYIWRTLFQYNQERLPCQLSKIIIRKQLFWVRSLNDLLTEMDMQTIEENISPNVWKFMEAALIERVATNNRTKDLRRARQSNSRIYKHLDLTRGTCYFNGNFNRQEISWIFKARCDLICLSGNRYISGTDENNNCTICNINEKETLQHFLGNCPILREIRIQIFGKPHLQQHEIVSILDGHDGADWKKLVSYLISALRYRKLILNEYN